MRDLVSEILKGNPRAIARAITLVENNGQVAQELMKKIFPHRKDAVVLGITGAPGTGKSTLVDQMVVFLRKVGYPVGIIAVDPSSPFTGGAILGDRIRMMRHSVDSGVFIRSMATRGHLGGLAKATGEVIALFEAAGKRIILVETVGVGQDEVEVVKLADIIIVVLTPGTGDDIQAFKAGIMEIGDIFVLNKSDHPQAERFERQLRAMLEMSAQKEELPPVVKTVATEAKGVEELMKEIERFRCGENQKFQMERKRRLLSWMLKDILRGKLERILNQYISERELEEYVEKIYQREADPYAVADEIIERVKKKNFS